MSYPPYSGSTDSPSGPEESSERRSSSRLIITSIVVGSLLLFGAVFWKVFIDPDYRDPGLRPIPAASLPTVAVPLPAPKVGSPAPDFELVDLNTNRPLTLSSLRGKPVWINFWATWCPPCKEEMPIMEKLYEENKGKGLVILGVDVQEKESDVLPYIKEGGYRWTFVIDKTGKITDNYHVGGLPSHYFVDKDGLIQAIVIGGLKSEMTGEIRDVTPYLQKILP